MNFDSIFFTTVFLPIAVIAVAALRRERARNIALLAFGLLFYAFSGLGGVAYIVLCALVNYLLLKTTKREKEKSTANRTRTASNGGNGANTKRNRGAAVAAIVLNLALLCFYKYLNPLLSGFNLNTVSITAPLGISFITFRCISAAIDIKRGKSEPPENFFDYLLYVSFFPQITAGPIMRWGDFQSQLSGRTISREEIANGLCRFIFGLSKKLIIAGALGEVADGIFSMESGELTAVTGWVGAIAYTLQIYFDFSGYSDIAIGMGQIFGFITPENFEDPYAAVSVTDFWRRWHISLSSWFRDYLYIPLGGNRKGKARTAINKFIVFALCGLWHGAAPTFIVWGAWHGVFSALESANLIDIKTIRKTPLGRVMSRIYALAVICVGFVFFRAENIAFAFNMISAMFTEFTSATAGTVAIHSLLNARSLCAGALSILLCIPHGKAIARIPNWAKYALCIILLVICLGEMAVGGFTPFIYAQF